MTGNSNEVEQKVLPGEEHFGSAARRHMRLANELSPRMEFSAEARFHALMALECFLKELFCRLRFERHGAPSDGSFVRFKPAREFSHDLRELMNAVMRGIPEERRRRALQRLKAELSTSKRWNEERYGATLDPGSETWKSTVEIMSLTEEVFGVEPQRA